DYCCQVWDTTAKYVF
nr:immunoglobulin light chain junction region [Macaca mulatta]MOW56998.1 immunoglobulin light chain junction region [Macaca mulatta]MOW58646.1 immunoglobulin light chain junction region [Macaca mulatta]MOW58654.1 immunoglobulin light chain junction region [Macaca mulatta]MOW60372.1 immunoglobulin light chain junction region [Macaca mulatta]